MKIVHYAKVWFTVPVRPAEFHLPVSGLADLGGKVELRRVIDDWEDTLIVVGYGSVPEWEVPWSNVSCAVRATAAAPAAPATEAPSPPSTKPAPKDKDKDKPRLRSPMRPKLSAAQMLEPKGGPDA